MTLEKAANLMTVVVATALCAFLGYQVLQGRQTAASAGGRRPLPGPSSLVGYQVGDRLPQVAGVALDSRLTLVLAIRSTCVFCQASMPFYRDLAALVRKSNGNAALVFTSVEGEAEFRQYLSSEQLDREVVLSAPLETFRVSGTPALIAIDGNRVVRASWSGKLDSVREEEVFAMVRSAS